MPYYELHGVDEIERMRHVRRELEQQFETADEFFDWMEELQRQHDRRVDSKEMKRTIQSMEPNP